MSSGTKNTRRRKTPEMETIKLGSLFDGSGGFPLAACAG
nr:MAG TPA: hypothetical protein [Caudoviricetes sp.]